MSNFLSAARSTDPIRPEKRQVEAWQQAWQALDEDQRAAFIKEFGPTTNFDLPQDQRHEVPLEIPYFSSHSLLEVGQPADLTLTSVCAMLTSYLRPNAITGPTADRQYLEKAQSFGDVTEAETQITTLKSFGIKARFVKTADLLDYRYQLGRKVPIPCGYKKPSNPGAAAGGYGWICVKGMTSSHVIVNDPLGQLDLVSGQYVSSNGNSLAYPIGRWRTRWLGDQQRSGWAIIADR